MTNILEAIINISESPTYNIINHYSTRNRINNVGVALECFLKDAFADTIKLEDEEARTQKHSNVFSWLGNQNNPPDFIIQNGDAIEVKKLQGGGSELALNSSYPKSTLKANDPMITDSCRACEDWEEKDMLYCIGHTTDNTIKALWLVYGSIYAAKHETYQIIKQKVSDGINEIPNIEFAETKELGRVNRIDPLGITRLRIRGMWHIQTPRRVFDYIYKSSPVEFELVAIIPNTKYNSFPRESIAKIESLENASFMIDDVKVKDPNNPANLIDAKLITYIVRE